MRCEWEELTGGAALEEKKTVSQHGMNTGKIRKENPLRPVIKILVE